MCNLAVLIYKRLEDTLQVLQLKETETQSSNRCRPAISQREPLNNQNHNRYALLDSRAANYKDEMKIEDTVLTTPVDEDYDAQTQTTISDDDLLFADDDLGEWIELSLFISVSCVSIQSTSRVLIAY
jgi:hypothetical protein